MVEYRLILFHLKYSLLEDLLIVLIFLVTFESVTEMMDQWESAFTAGDFSSAASVYEENATLTVAGREYTSSAEIENFFKKFYNGVTKQAEYTITAKTSSTVQFYILLKNNSIENQNKKDLKIQVLRYQLQTAKQ